MFRVIFPVLVSVATIGELVTPTVVLGKESGDGSRVTVKVVPLHVRAAVCGLPEALSVIERFPDLAPAVVGLHATCIEQLIPGPRLVPQLFAPRT